MVYHRDFSHVYLPSKDVTPCTMLRDIISIGKRASLFIFPSLLYFFPHIFSPATIAHESVSRKFFSHLARND